MIANFLPTGEVRNLLVGLFDLTTSRSRRVTVTKEAIHVLCRLITVKACVVATEAAASLYSSA